MKELYNMLLHRRSIRHYDKTLKITEEELKEIEEKIHNLKPLIENIGISYKILDVKDTNCKWDGQYCLLIYSEEKEGYLQNVGYMFEQLDLYFAQKSIGACWYGWGKTDEKEYEGKQFVIMINFGKSKSEDFRTDISRVKRKELADIWEGDTLGIADIVKYAPSACNSQPWRIKCDGKNIEVFRNTNITAMLAKGLVAKYNKIDMGIFLCFLEIVLEEKEYNYKKEIYIEQEAEKKLLSVAKYELLEE